MNLTPTVPETQSEILLILKEFDRVCRENGIRYSLHGGTLLGAIRDKGFIPWDDDADVTMLRAEYDKLKQCFDRESQEYYLTEGYLHMPRIIRKKYGKETPFAWLDIMIYDPISEGNFAGKLKIGMCLAFQAMCRDSKTIRLSEGKNHGKLSMLAFKMAYLLGKPFSYERKYRWYNRFCEKRLCGSGKYIHRSNDQLRGLKLRIPSEYLMEYIDVPFADTKLMVTKDYHQILLSSYGESYMTPVQDEANDTMHVHFKRAFLENLHLIDEKGTDLSL